MSKEEIPGTFSCQFSWQWPIQRWRRSPNIKMKFVFSLWMCQVRVFVSLISPHGFTVTWWTCYGLCLWRKLTQLAHSFLFCSCVYYCFHGLFNCISFIYISQQLSVFLFCFLGLNSVWLVLSSLHLSLIHIWRCRRDVLCRSRWSPYH